jgi:hypothetical protein
VAALIAASHADRLEEAIGEEIVRTKILGTEVPEVDREGGIDRRAVDWLSAQIRRHVGDGMIPERRLPLSNGPALEVRARQEQVRVA